jgi:glucokinase
MCGGRGCVEAYVGGTYLLARIRRERPASIVDRAGSLDAVHVGHVDAAAADGDPWALALWREVSWLFAIALGNALAMLNSERLILGGGVLSRTPTLRVMTEHDLRRVAPPASLEPLSIAMAELGDDAGLVGAARLASAGVSVIRSGA